MPFMPSDRSADALFDIRDNIVLARQFIDKITLEDFRSDRMRFYAVTRALEIISEATRRLHPEIRERHSSLPWRAIMGVGNVYRHDYDNVAEDFVWRTVCNNLNELLIVIEKEIAERPR
jgi:uncharacterized protein with HEPN domain